MAVEIVGQVEDPGEDVVRVITGALRLHNQISLDVKLPDQLLDSRKAMEWWLKFSDGLRAAREGIKG